MKTKLLIAMSAVIVSSMGALPAQAQEGQAGLKAACETAYTVEGGFTGGRRFKSKIEIPKVESSDAVTSLGQAMAADGRWKNIQANKDIGTVTGVRDIPPKGSKQFTMNFIVKRRSPDGVTVDATISTPALIMTDAKGMEDTVCTMLAAAGG